MEPDQHARFKRALVGGMVLFAIAFPVVNILAVDICISVAEGSWRPPFRDWAGGTAVACYPLTVLPWLLLLRRYRRWAENHDVLNVQHALEKRAVLLSGALVALALSARMLMDRSSALSSDYGLHVRLWGSHIGLLVTVELYVYYLLEGVLMVWIADAFQGAGEALSGMTRVPWGGVGLAATWGASHIYTKGLSMGMAAMLYGLFVGVVYLVGRRNIAPPVVAWLVNYM